ncbi:MAG: PaaI family thioesterase [Promethearchaeota archaeon]
MSNVIQSLDLIKNKFKADQYANNLGIILDEITEKQVKMHLALTEKHENFYGRPHGGVIYSLADAAFSVIGNSDNNVSVAIECSISYHASPEPKSILHVIGERVAESRKIGTYLFTIYTLKNNEKHLIATMKSTLYRTGKKIDESI